MLRNIHQMLLIFFAVVLTLSCEVKKSSVVEHQSSLANDPELPWGHTGRDSAPQNLVHKTPLEFDNITQKSNVKALSKIYLFSKLSLTERNAIQIYTMGPSKFYWCNGTSLEEARCKTLQDLSGKKNGDNGPKYCESMQSAYKHIPPSPGVVYRGIFSVKINDINRLFTAMQEHTTLTLDPGPFRTWKSATRELLVAKEIMNQSDININTDYKILYVINQKSGRSIENISIYPEQEEVLLHPDALYKVENMQPIKGTKASVVVTLTEVPPSLPVANRLGFFCGCL